jgi:hypothetical protein
MTRPGEYITDTVNNRPRKRRNFRMDRIWLGIRIDRVAANRRIARRAITEIQPTEMIFQMSKWAWLVSVKTPDPLNCGGPNARRKIGYRRKNLRNDRRFEAWTTGRAYSLLSIHRADCIMWLFCPRELQHSKVELLRFSPLVRGDRE